MSCIFCEIIKGNIPSHKIWEDESAFAFLDIHPINEGHALVIPKKHEPDLHNLEESEYAGVMHAVREVSLMVDKALQPKKVGLLVAGWDVPHAHVHVVPMNDYHDLTSKKLMEKTLLAPSDEELSKTREKIIS